MTTMTTDAAADHWQLRRAYGQFPTGVVAVAAEVGGDRVGLAVSSFVPVSLDPPLVAVCMQHTSTTWPRLRCAPHLGVSVLADTHGAAARTLARKTGDRFAGLETVTADDGALFVEDATTWLDTTIADTVAAGDHALVLLRVGDLEVRSGEPIVFHASMFRGLAATSGESRDR